MQTATSKTESKALDLSIRVHHNTLRALGLLSAPRILGRQVRNAPVSALRALSAP